MAKKPEKPLSVFFDSNIFGDLVAPKNPDAVSLLNIIEVEISEGHIRIIPSWETIREIFFVLEKDNILCNQPNLYSRIVDWLYVLKPAEDILRDDILGFAQTGEPELPFVRPDHWLWDYITPIRLGKKLFSKSKVKELSTKQSELDQGFVNRVLNRVDPEKAKEVLKSKGKSQPNVEIQWMNLWQAGGNAQRMARKFADDLNVLKECERRGLEKLLQLSTIRLTIGYRLHSFYMQTFNKKTNFELSDAMDFRHATCAGAVGNIVTKDNKLMAAIKHIPDHNIIVWSLDEFIRYCDYSSYL
jgi:hypothetical protein